MGDGWFDHWLCLLSDVAANLAQERGRLVNLVADGALLATLVTPGDLKPHHGLLQLLLYSDEPLTQGCVFFSWKKI